MSVFAASGDLLAASIPALKTVTLASSAGSGPTTRRDPSPSRPLRAARRDRREVWPVAALNPACARPRRPIEAGRQMTSLRGEVLRARREAAVKLWQQGQSAAVIAVTLGLTLAVVRNDVWLSRKANPDGVPLRERAPLTAAQRTENCVLRAEGRSHAAMAHALGVEQTSIHRALRKAAMAKAAGDVRPAIGDIGPQIVAMWEAGHKGGAIADRFGLACSGDRPPIRHPCDVAPDLAAHV